MGIQTTHPEPTEQGDAETVSSLTVTGLTASRLVATDGSKGLASIANLQSWVAGTSNQINTADDGDGSITLSLSSTLVTPGTLTVTGHATPASDNTYDIGGAAAQWRTVYVGTSVVLGAAALLSWSTDLHLVRDAANTLAQKNGTTAQEFRVYGTTTGPKYSALVHTGTAGRIRTSESIFLFRNLADSSYVGIDALDYTVRGGTGIQFGTDNAQDIGASGSGRPRTIYVGTSVDTPTVNRTSGNLTLQTTTSGSVILAPNGTARFTVATSGITSCGCDLHGDSDNGRDLGAVGTRWRSGYFGTSVNVVTGAVLLDTNGITMGDAKNIILNTTTGTKIGTGTTQKLGFYNATPVVQATGIVDADGTLGDVTTKFNSLLSKMEAYGLLAVA